MRQKIRFKMNILLLGVLGLGFLSCASSKYLEGLYAELETSKGLIVLQLEFEKTPMTVANFVGLSEGIIKNSAFTTGTPYYNGTTFHRVVSGHVIQAGAPTGEEREGPGYNFPNEIHSDLSHDQAGMLGMANGGPHTNSGQFYITLGDRSYLDGDYTVFGSVIQGMEVVNSIVQDDVIKNIKIVRVGKKAKQFKADETTFRQLVSAAKIRVVRETEDKAKEEAAYIQSHWPEAVITEAGWKYIIAKAGKGKKPMEGAKLKLSYSGQFLDGRKFYSTTEEGKPNGIPPEEIFEFEIGKNTINPGLDEAILQMQKGEKRVIILPASLAYGSSGFYGRQKPGEKRFVISPNTTLVYEIELIDF